MLDRNELRVYWEMKDFQGKIAATGCVESRQQNGYTKDRYNRTNPFYSTSGNQTVIYGNIVDKDSINIELYKYPTLMKVIEKDFRIELSVAPHSKCVV